MDTVKVPKVPAGEYVVGWRWDCEESAQVWQVRQHVAHCSTQTERNHCVCVCFFGSVPATRSQKSVIILRDNRSFLSVVQNCADITIAAGDDNEVATAAAPITIKGPPTRNYMVTTAGLVL